MPQTRQLAAIMFTDIVGYTALMCKDEQKAFSILNENRLLQKPIIEKYGGRWIKELGDGVLASFTTVSDAVYAAQEIQQQCKERFEFSLRIGIHLGEIVFEDDDVFGDAVNVASRIQANAPVGGIYISETINKDVANKADVKTRFIKAEKLKNVKEPVKIYEVITGVSTQHAGKQQITNFKLNHIISVAVLLLVIVGIYLLYITISNNKETGTISNKSIAVLPFVNMSNDKEQEYFSDGLSDQFINVLAKTPGLKVIARTSSFAFKGKTEDIRSIGEKLGVDHILEGSVQRSGEQIRIKAFLIKAKDGTRIWNETYDRQLTEIFKVQDEIAMAVVDALKVELLGKEKTQVLKRYTNNPAAFSYYLRGNFHLYRFTPEDLGLAFKFFHQAINLDTNYALAYTGLASAYGIADIWDDKTVRKAEAAIQRAIEIDPNLAEAHALAGATYFWNRHDIKKAQAEFTRAIELNKNSSIVHHYYSWFLIGTNRFKEASQHLQQALTFDPLSIALSTDQGLPLYFNREYKNAESYYRKALEIYPGFHYARFRLAEALEGKGDYAGAVRELEEVLRSGVYTSLLQPMLARALALAGKKSEARANLEKIKTEQMKVSPYFISLAYVALNDSATAISQLQRAIEEHDKWIGWIKVDPRLDPLRSDPRFHEILQKAGLK